MDKARETLIKQLGILTEKRGAKADIRRATGFSGSQLDGYASGNISPTLDQLDRLADALGIPAWQLIKPDETLLNPLQRELTRLVSRLADEEKLSLVLALVKQMLPPEVEKNTGKPS